MPEAKPKFKKDIYLLGRRRYTASTKEVYILWTNKYNLNANPVSVQGNRIKST